MDATTEIARWTTWSAVDPSGFEVLDDGGEVCIAQVGERTFRVLTPFRFCEPGTLAAYRRQLEDAGHEPAVAERMLARATSVTGDVVRTDLASIPRCVQWFESPYGRHTLAAILHDELITTTPNGGALGSDVMADRLFRDMLGVVGVSLAKRWVMWTAVAARTRWAAGGRRRWSLVAWVLLAMVGHGLLYAGLAGAATNGSALPAAAATALPAGAALLWGRQYVAGLIAAAAGLVLLPATLLVLVGMVAYGALDRCAGLFERRRTAVAAASTS